EELAAFNITLAGIDTGGNPARAWAYEVSGNYFDALHIRPYLGRFFHAGDEHGLNSAPYVVLAYGYWRSHFHDDPGIVGRTIQVNRYPFTVVGIAPPEFRGTLLMLSPDFFVPLVNHEQMEGASSMGKDVMNTRGSRWIFAVLGHLKPGVSPEQGAADL